MPANPLPEDGVVGKLTEEQEAKLKEFWLEFLRLADEAPEKGTVSGVDKQKTEMLDEKEAQKAIPKDDAEKDRVRAQQDLKEAKLALEKYGRKRFLATFFGFVMMDDPDVIALRFLRARKWEIPRGVAMLAACMKWRIESGVEDIVEKGEAGLMDIEKFDQQLTSGKTYTQGTDRAGRPVCYIHVRLHKVTGQPADTMQTFVFQQMEAIRLMMADRAEKVTMIFDMTSFGLGNMDWRVILLLVRCLEAYYPESLNVMIIHKAPLIFRGIWLILGPLFDPVVRNKVQMTKKPEDLIEHIAPEHLVSQLGGKNEYKWEYKGPVDGENDKMKDTKTRDKLQGQRDDLIKAYIEATRKWGKSNDKGTALQRKYLAVLMRDQYYALDPYVRGRTEYHRDGTVLPDGKVCFTYPGTDQEETIGETRCRSALEKQLDELEQELKSAGAQAPFDRQSLKA